MAETFELLRAEAITPITDDLTAAVAADTAIATAAATTATTQAGVATTQAGIATTKAGEAAASATTATTQASTATTQAGIATTKANEADADAATVAADKLLVAADKLAADNSAIQAAASAAAAQQLVLSNATAFPSIRPRVVLDFSNSRFVPPIITFVRNTIGTYFDSKGMMQVAKANIPRISFDPINGKCMGLKIEESRTNLVRNSTMVGAVIGNLGTFPNNWQRTQMLGNNIDAEVVSLPVDKGISCIDLRWTGTPGNSNRALLDFDSSFYTATSGQILTVSVYLKIAAGAILGNECNFGCTFLDSGNNAIGTSNSNFFVPTSALTRYSFTTSAAPSGTAKIRIWFSAGYSGQAGISQNFTLRFGAPQAEIGNIATSFIPTINAAVVRNADYATIQGTTFTNLIEKTAGTIYIETNLELATSASIVAIGNGGFGDALTIRERATPDITINVRTTGQPILDFALYPITLNSITKAVLSWNQDATMKACVNGSSITTGPIVTSAYLTNLVRLTIGASADPFASLPITGHILRMYYYPIQLTNTEIQTLSIL